MKVKDVLELDINILVRDDKDLIGFKCDGVYLGDFTKTFILKAVTSNKHLLGDIIHIEASRGYYNPYIKRLEVSE